ncbi:hypothetical protein [Actinoplanes sp. HUAS TT8]|uniref:hypothetical protein n=1 Tax=Actinoplanes sp. HUAS TT8 TaxID=3447453 RepID=UPI003F524D0E
MINIVSSPEPDPSTVAASQATQRLHREALSRVRVAALAWRNGLAALLAGLLGFSLVKGRSDVGQLATPWNILVGGTLLIAVIAGGLGALRLLQAAHGRPALTDRRTVRSLLALEVEEAEAGARDLRIGITSTLVCAALLIIAVATTWYGPAKQTPKIRITTPGSTLCGSTTRMGHGQMVLQTQTGEQVVDLSTATGIQAVADC